MDGKVGQTEGGIRASIRPSGLTLSWSPTSAGLVQGALNPAGTQTSSTCLTQPL